MFESVVSTVLNKALGDFVEDFDPAQLRVGIWGGDVKLGNLRLKKSALEQFHLPIDVKEGYIGSVVLKIPWTNLKSAPVRVSIDTLYLLAGPRSETIYNAAKEEEHAFQAKMSKLEMAELLDQQRSQPEEDPSKGSFATQLVTKIVDNVQLSITNIHIRYEDASSNPGHRFAAGVTLHKLSAQSTNGSWQEMYVQDTTSAAHKLVTLDSLAVYFNTDSESLANHDDPARAFKALIASGGKGIDGYQYILKPVSGIGKVTMNRVSKPEVAKNSVSLQFDEIAFMLDDEQYRNTMLCLNYMHFAARQEKYRALRPTNSTPKTHPRRWIAYAGQCVLREVHENRRRWTWDYFAQRRDQRIKYVHLFTQKQVDPNWSQQSGNNRQLANLEHLLSYEDLRFYRSIARANMRKEQAYQDRIREKHSTKNKIGGWLSGLWGDNKQSAQGGAEEHGDTPVLSEKEVKAFYETIEFDENALPSAVPKESIIVALNTHLKCGSFTLRYSPRTGDKELVSVLLESFTADVIKRPENLVASAMLQDFQIRDSITTNTLYPLLAKVQSSQAASLSAADPLLHLRFDHKPLDGRADDVIELAMRKMEFVYSRAVVLTLANFFRAPESTRESLSVLADAASHKLKEYKDYTLTGMEFALQKHQTLDLNVNIGAPIIVFPESCTDASGSAAVADLGNVKVKSEPADKCRVDEIQKIRTQSDAGENVTQLGSLMYDRINVELSSVQVVVGESVDRCLEVISTLDIDDVRHVVNRIGVNIAIDKSIVPSALDLPALKVKGRLPLLQVNFSDQKYRTLMRILKAITPPSKPVSTGKKHQKMSQRLETLDRQEAMGLSGELVLETPDDDSTVQGEEGAALADEISIATEKTAVAKTSTPAALQTKIKVAFDLERVAVAIRRSHPNDPLNETALAELVLSQIGLHLRKREFDMDARLELQSFSISGLVSADQDAGAIDLVSSGVHDDESQGAKQALVRITFSSATPESPDFETAYAGIEQTLDVSLSRLNILVESSNILALQDFALDTFVDQTQSSQGVQSLSTAGEDDSTVSQQDSEQSSRSKPPLARIKATAALQAIYITVADGGTEIAVASIEGIGAQLSLEGKSIEFDARLESLAVSGVALESADQGPPKLLEIAGDELAHLHYSTFDPSKQDYPGYDSAVKLRLGSLHFTFLEHLVKHLVIFGGKFSRLQQLSKTARKSATKSAAQLQERAVNMHMDVLVLSPVLVFPCNETSSPSSSVVGSDAIRMYLGEVSLSNEFQPDAASADANAKLDNMTLALKSFSIVSELDLGQSQPQKLHIIDDIHFSLNLVRAARVSGLDRPEMQVTFDMSDVCVKVTERQFERLMLLTRRVTWALDGEKVAPAAPKTDVLAVVTAAAGASQLKQKAAAAVMRAKKLRDTTGVQEDSASRIRGALELKTVSLELFSGDGTDGTLSLEQASLSRFSLNDIKTSFDMRVDGSANAELQLGSFIIADSRADNPSLFKEIARAAADDGPQLSASLARRPVGDIDVNAAVSGARVVLTLSYLFALRDFALGGLQYADAYGPGGGKSTKKQQVAHQKSKSAAAKETRITVHAKAVDFEVIMLENPESESSSAVVLSVPQVVLKKEDITSLSVKDISMVLCRMDARDTTWLRLLDKFRIQLSLDDGAAEFGRNSTMINVDVTPIVFRASYRNIMMILDAVKKASELGPKKAKHHAVVDVAHDPVQVQRAKDEAVLQSSEATETPDSQRLDDVDAQTAREELSLSMGGFQFVLVSDRTEVSVLDLKVEAFAATVKDWSSAMSASTTIPVVANFFNFKNSHWEPVIEPWQLGVKVLRAAESGAISVEASADSRLELNFSHALIHALKRMQDDWKAEAKSEISFARSDRLPYLLRNRSGHSLTVWAEARDCKDEVESTHQLPDGEELPWNFEEWHKQREKLEDMRSCIGVKFDDGTWENVSDVPVDAEGTAVYTLSPSVAGIPHRLVCEVVLKNDVKVVTFRSTLIVENTTTTPLEVTMTDICGKVLEQTYQIGMCPSPRDYYAVPITAVCDARVRIRPLGDSAYDWSTEPIYWRDFLASKPPTAALCQPTQQGRPMHSFCLFGMQDNKSLNAKGYPSMSIRVGAPMELENLLPFDLEYRLVDSATKKSHSSRLHKGSTSQIHYVQTLRTLLLNVDVLDTEYDTSKSAVISTSSEDDLELDSFLALIGPNDTKLQLCIDRVVVPNSGGALRVSIYSPYLLVNKTGVDVVYAAKSNAKTAMPATIGDASEFADGQSKQSMFSYKNSNTSDRLLVKLQGTSWSPPVSLEAVGSHSELLLDSPNGENMAYMGVSISKGGGQYHKTKIITFTPRFIIRNYLDTEVYFREADVATGKALASGQHTPVLFLSNNKEKRLVLRLSGEDTPWSAPFGVADIGKVHVRARRSDGTPELVRVEILLQGATIFVSLHRETGKWPYRIENRSSTAVDFYQRLSAAKDAPATDSPSVERYTVPSQSTVEYAWDYPSLVTKQLVLSVNGKEQELSLQEIGPCVPFKYSDDNGEAVMDIDVVADGPVQVLKLSDFNPERSIYRKVDHGLNAERFEAISVEAAVQFSVSLRLNGVGVSLVSQRVEEIAYLLLRDINVKVTDSELHQTVSVKCGWIQLDNQLRTAAYPLVLFPTALSKNRTESEQPPVVQLSAIRSKDTVHGVEYIKYLSLLLQEISVDVDTPFLYEILAFTRPDADNVQPTAASQLCVEDSETPAPKLAEGASQLYFEVLHVQPLKLNLTFTHIEKQDESQNQSILASVNPIAVLISVLVTTIGNISDAPIRVNALLLENLRTTQPLLVGLMTQHYKQQLIFQVHRLVGSADILGNPVSLFGNISSGVMDIFYEPYQGFISDRPQDLGIGLAKGGASFLKKTVFGLSNSLSKVTGSLGKGLAAATLDSEYQANRQAAHRRNRPRHALDGVSQGATSLVSSVWSGGAGVIQQPLAGAQKGGFGGFLKGTGKGLIGLVAKPVVGVVDLATNLTEGIRNTTTMFDDHAIDRERPPRHVGSDKVLRVYNRHEAVGQDLLWNGNAGALAQENYVAHIELDDSHMVLILAETRLVSINSKRLSVDQNVAFLNLRDAKTDGRGTLCTTLRDGRAGPAFSAFSTASPEDMVQLKQQLDDALSAWNQKHRTAL
ncbi:hypothetical protein THASP1DRAFT_27093 [Thamnocephalis sphaerospora]|uniref:Vacuolar protein sorting-associated protein n=1 Tax=Thamnocephalis sphaerospora TaxID=78915 RepID=A0A4P9XXR0_9FUNG|nr:hypothetical protein THASP1DRAFT_27093 [Thamnocephalis sphaerospora]|eukprot:RKP11114.1 hypothetical protein THASP1DRAFT_27093 [Thamnocephalis sphaerospora]